MKMLQQQGNTCTEYSLAMILDLPIEFVMLHLPSIHIQAVMDFCYELGNILFEVQQHPLAHDPLERRTYPLLQEDKAKFRFHKYLEHHRALLYQAGDVPHMYAWDPQVGAVDPRLGRAVKFPDIRTAYLLQRKK